MMKNFSLKHFQTQLDIVFYTEEDIIYLFWTIINIIMIGFRLLLLLLDYYYYFHIIYFGRMETG